MLYILCLYTAQDEPRDEKKMNRIMFSIFEDGFFLRSTNKNMWRRWSRKKATRKNIIRSEPQKCSVCVIFPLSLSLCHLVWLKCNDTLSTQSNIRYTYNVNVARYESHVFAVMFVTCALARCFFTPFFWLMWSGWAYKRKLSWWLHWYRTGITDFFFGSCCFSCVIIWIQCKQ